MPMNHKAFVFDYDGFRAEFSRVLAGALEQEDTSALKAWIHARRTELVDPYEGEPLEEDWEDRLENGDVHEYGDFALTKYYDPAEDIGLGDDWHEMTELLKAIGLEPGILLGTPFGPPEARFDPGKMGSYFQAPSTVRAHLQSVDQLLHHEPSRREQLDPVKRMLRDAVAATKGLYVTF